MFCHFLIFLSKNQKKKLRWGKTGFSSHMHIYSLRFSPKPLKKNSKATRRASCALYVYMSDPIISLVSVEKAMYDGELLCFRERSWISYSQVGSEICTLLELPFLSCTCSLSDFDHFTPLHLSLHLRSMGALHFTKQQNRAQHIGFSI